MSEYEQGVGEMVGDPHRQRADSGPATRTPRGEMQRQTLVRIAFELIAEGGFEHLRTREVAGRAGVNIATLHYYFPTKEDLVGAVVELLDHQMATTHAPVADPGTLNALEELRRDLADGPYQVRVSPQTWVVWFELLMRSLRDPAIHDLMREAQAHWRRHIESYLVAGAQQGIFRPDLDVEAVGAGLVAIINGSALQAMTDPDAFPTERVFAEVERWLVLNAKVSTQTD